MDSSVRTTRFDFYTGGTFWMKSELILKKILNRKRNASNSAENAKIAKWRRGWDSNPRGPKAASFSRAAS